MTTINEKGSGGLPLLKKKKKRNHQDLVFIISFLIYPLILFVVFYLYVNVNSIFLAFKNISFIGEETWVGFANFKKFIDYIGGANTRWAVGFVNSIKLYLISLIICLPLYIVLSYILFKKCFMHKQLRIIVMVPQIISGFIMCLVFKRFVEGSIPEFMIQVVGKETFPNLLRDAKYSFGTTLFYSIWVSFSTSLIVYPNAMNEIDDSVIEAAKLDGVGNMFQELWYILLPLIFPTISTFLITGFAGIMMNAGSIPTFFMYSAPQEAVNIGYLYWCEVANASTFNGFPLLAAGGLLMTLFVAPLTLLLRWALEKFGPDAEI